MNPCWTFERALTPDEIQEWYDRVVAGDGNPFVPDMGCVSIDFIRATETFEERDGVKIVCRWDRPLTEDDYDKLLAADGDCRAAGIPCENHPAARGSTPASYRDSLRR